MARNSDRIELEAISNIRKCFFKIEDKLDINILIEIQSNDKTPLTDGFLRINGKDIPIQVKGKAKKSNKLSINMEYYHYAKQNLLLFFYCDNTDGDSSSIYYEFFSIKFLEKKLKGKNTQKSISHTFDKKLDLTNCEEFINEFNKEFQERDIKKKSTLFRLLKQTQNIEVKGKISFDAEKFQEEIQFIPQKIISNETSLEYGFDNAGNEQIKLLAKKNDGEIDFSGKKILYKEITNAVGDKEFDFKNYKITFLRESQKIFVTIRTIKRAKDININELNFLKSIFDSCFDSVISLYDKLDELICIREKFDNLISLHCELELIGSTDVIPLYDILMSSANKSVIYIESLNNLYTFYYHDNKYVLLGRKTSARLSIGDEYPTRWLDIEALLLPFVLNYIPYGNMINFESYGIDKEEFTRMSMKMIAHIDESYSEFVYHFITNIISVVDKSLVDNKLISTLFDYIDQLDESDNKTALKILGLFLQSICKELKIEEKILLHQFLSESVEFEDKVILLATLGEKEELEKYKDDLKSYVGEYKNLMRYIYYNSL